MTALEWFVYNLNSTPGVLDQYYCQLHDVASLIKKARQMEKEQMEIPELSDEEIQKAADRDDYFPVQTFAFIKGANWYREQLKQKL